MKFILTKHFTNGRFTPAIGCGIILMLTALALPLRAQDSRGTNLWIPSAPITTNDLSEGRMAATNAMQLSFQGANVDMVVQWIAQTTGKSVIKHPQVQCQLTINSSKKVSPREALNLVYRALALEGISVVEFQDSILIAPQGKEPLMNPQVLDNSSTNVPEGRQRLVKVFQLKYIQPTDLRDRISPALSDKATVYVDDQTKQIIITDYNDNLRVASQLITALDANIAGDVTVRVLPLKNIIASELRQELGPLYQRQGRAFQDSVQVTADDRSNTLIILSSETNFKIIQQFVALLDTEQAGDVIVRTIALKHLTASDLARSISQLYYRNGRSFKDSVQITADDQSNTLIILSSSVNFRLIQQYIEELDAEPASDVIVRTIPLKHITASELVRSLGPLYYRGGRSFKDSVQVTADDQSNTLIVQSSAANFKLIQQYVSELDQEPNMDVTVRAIPLKNINATDLVRELLPLYQRNYGRSLKDSVQVSADDQANALIIQSSSANFKLIQQFVTDLDTDEARDKIMRTFTLKNADAQDLAKQLQDLNSDQSANTRYYYNFGSNDRSKKMTIVADRRRNAVIVQAPPAKMDGIAQMIEELDQPITDDSLAPRIYPMKYTSATDIEDVLNQLFLKKQQQRSYWDYYGFGDDNSSSTGSDVGRLYGKVRITSEPYSNALIITANSQENLAAVEAVIKQLDRPSEDGESTLHVGLRFAKADVLANSINILFAKNGSPPMRPATPQNQNNNQNNNQSSTPGSSQASFDLTTETKQEGYFPWLGGQPDSAYSANGANPVRPVSDLVGRVRAVADNRSNALLISANVHFFPQILKMIDNLDQPAEQVVIEARIVQVSSDYLDQLGVRFSPDGSQQFSGNDYDNSFMGNVSANYQKGFGGNTRVNTPASPAASVAQALTELRTGVLTAGINMDFLIQFLHRTVNATVLAEPQLTIRNNEPGKLFVGKEVPIPANTQISSVGSQNTSITYKEVGVTLEVTPHINNSGDVELRIHAGSSTEVPGQTILGGAIFNTANFRTDLTAKNGETLVVGGIIQKQLSDTTRKTPFLGNIPGLGWAFKKKDKSSQEMELMVFLRPRVIRTSEDAREILRDLDQRAPAIKQWQDDTSTNNAPVAAKTVSNNKNAR